MYLSNIICFCGESYFAPSDTEQNLLINFSSKVKLKLSALMLQIAAHFNFDVKLRLKLVC